jgi:hypothetical protein
MRTITTTTKTTMSFQTNEDDKSMLDRGQMKHDNYLGDDETKSYCDVSKQV